MVLQDAAGSDFEVFIDNLTPHQVEFATQCFLLSALHACETVSGEPRHFLDPNHQVHIAVPSFRKLDGHIAEQPLVPEVPDGCCKALSWDNDLVANLQAAEQLDRLNVGVLSAQNGDTRDSVVAWHREFERV